MKIGIFAAILAVVVVAVIIFTQYAGFKETGCQTDSDCVPKECCHQTTCVSAEKADKCAGILCTEVCVPGTLDCNQGKCICSKGKCAAEMSK
jgi:hypothetical protein